MSDYDDSIRQPQPGDIVGSRLQVAALGTAYEADWEWKLTTNDETLAKGYFRGGGGSGFMATFLIDVPLDDVTYVGPATFELSGDGGSETPTFTKVPVVVIPGATGYWPYRVKEGDTLTSIAASRGSDVAKIAAASQLANPDYIEVGQLLRIPG